MAASCDIRTSQDLKAWRRSAGWSQMDLARMAGVHVQTVKYHEGMDGFVAGWAVDRFRAAFELQKVLPPKTPCSVLFQHAVKGDGETCGAKTRKGTPCRQKPISGRARCKFHGGMSTGPKTKEGRASIAAAQHARWARSKLMECIASPL
jgi:hypothetical protein